MAERTMKIGEMARASGLSERALRHYEQVGLLRPRRTRAGQRAYGDADVRQLYSIRAMRGLGLSLSDIARVLDGRAQDPAALLRRHIDQVESELESLVELQSRLGSVLRAIERQESVSTRAFIQIMESMTMKEKYFSAEQLDQLRERAWELGEEGMRAAEREWADLIAAVRAEKERGADPSDESVRVLAKRWRDLTRQFTGNDPEIKASLAQMYQDEGASAVSRGMLDQEVMAFIGQAMQHLE